MLFEEMLFEPVFHTQIKPRPGLRRDCYNWQWNLILDLTSSVSEKQSFVSILLSATEQAVTKKASFEKLLWMKFSTRGIQNAEEIMHYPVDPVYKNTWHKMKDFLTIVQHAAGNIESNTTTSEEARQENE